MAVSVHFPDGTVRDVPGQLRRLAAEAGAPRYCFEQVPLKHDARWRFERQQDRWIATPRLGHILPLRPPAELWWSAIRQMGDTDDHASLTDRTAA